MDLENQIAIKYLDRIYFDPISGCWIWCGARNSSGYGHTYLKKKYTQLHRHFYEKLKDVIPDGLILDHLCRQRCCVNPDHLEAVQEAVNILRGIGPSAICAKQTECIYGHPLSGNNVYIFKNSEVRMRTCKECRRRRDRERSLKPERREKVNSNKRNRRMRLQIKRNQVQQERPS